MNKTNLEDFVKWANDQGLETWERISAQAAWVAVCKAKDAELGLLKVQIGAVNARLIIAEKQPSEAQAQIAMQAAKLLQAGDCIHDIGSGKGGWAWEEVLGEIQEALSATSETVAAWRAKETEPLRREVAMLHVTYKKMMQEWEEDGYLHQDTCDAMDAIFNNTKATALAYEREVENRGAVKALEETASKFDSGDWFARDILMKMAVELRAANKGEVK